jgi:hypothetical protein
LLPDTLSSGADPLVGGVLGDALDGFDGDGTTEPVHVTPLSEKAAGFGLVPLHAPLKPIDVDAPEPSDPFQLMLAAVTRVPDCVQAALQPWSTF